METINVKQLYLLSHSDEKNCVESGILYSSDSDVYDECVYMTSGMYKKIFGKTWKESDQEQRLLSIVKKQYKNHCIYRRYRCSFASGLCNDQIGINRRSYGLLCSYDKSINPEEITISAGNEKDFFENHPNHSTRMIYKLSKEANSMNKEATRISKASRIISYASLFVGIISIIIQYL